MGSISGITLGAVAGILAVRGYLTDSSTTDFTQITYEVFLAGLALKGVVEAATGNPVNTK